MRERLRKHASERPAEAAPAPKADESAEALKRATDDLLDEIDGVLEENAEAFVNAYVQQGGE